MFILNKFNCPAALMFINWNMITNKKFITWHGTNTSTFIFDILEGLQQGTVSSPILFNIINHQVINFFNLNSGNDNSHSLAFAEDLNVYVISDSPAKIQDKLEIKVNQVTNHYLD